MKAYFDSLNEMLGYSTTQKLVCFNDAEKKVQTQTLRYRRFK